MLGDYLLIIYFTLTHSPSDKLSPPFEIFLQKHFEGQEDTLSLSRCGGGIDISMMDCRDEDVAGGW